LSVSNHFRARKLTAKLLGKLGRMLARKLVSMLDLKLRPLHRDKRVALLGTKLDNKLATKLSA
jgi:hypothetical protein